MSCPTIFLIFSISFSLFVVAFPLSNKTTSDVKITANFLYSFWSFVTCSGTTFIILNLPYSVFLDLPTLKTSFSFTYGNNFFKAFTLPVILAKKY